MNYKILPFFVAILGCVCGCLQADIYARIPAERVPNFVSDYESFLKNEPAQYIVGIGEAVIHKSEKAAWNEALDKALFRADGLAEKTDFLDSFSVFEKREVNGVPSQNCRVYVLFRRGLYAAERSGLGLEASSLHKLEAAGDLQYITSLLNLLENLKASGQTLDFGEYLAITRAEMTRLGQVKKDQMDRFTELELGVLQNEKLNHLWWESFYALVAKVKAQMEGDTFELLLSSDFQSLCYEVSRNLYAASAGSDSEKAKAGLESLKNHFQSNLDSNSVLRFLNKIDALKRQVKSGARPTGLSRLWTELKTYGRKERLSIAPFQKDAWADLLLDLESIGQDLFDLAEQWKRYDEAVSAGNSSTANTASLAELRIENLYRESRLKSISFRRSYLFEKMRTAAKSQYESDWNTALVALMKAKLTGVPLSDMNEELQFSNELWTKAFEKCLSEPADALYLCASEDVILPWKTAREQAWAELLSEFPIFLDFKIPEGNKGREWKAVVKKELSDTLRKDYPALSFSQNENYNSFRLDICLEPDAKARNCRIQEFKIYFAEKLLFQSQEALPIFPRGLNSSWNQTSVVLKDFRASLASK